MEKQRQNASCGIPDRKTGRFCLKRRRTEYICRFRGPHVGSEITNTLYTSIRRERHETRINLRYDVTLNSFGRVKVWFRSRERRSKGQPHAKRAKLCLVIVLVDYKQFVFAKRTLYSDKTKISRQDVVRRRCSNLHAVQVKKFRRKR